MFFDRGEHLAILYPELLACNRGAKARVQQHGMFPLGRPDPQAACLTFRKQSRRRVEAREIV